jgi:hypothetical protein
MYERQPHRERRSSPYTELDQYTYGSSPLLDATWNDTNWNLEQTLGRVMGNLEVGVFLSLNIGFSYFNNSHNVLSVSETRRCKLFVDTHELKFWAFLPFKERKLSKKIGVADYGWVWA